MRKAMDLAMYIINMCSEANEPISNLQLQKILYFIQVAFLKKYDKPCFEDEFEAWKFGPVVKVVYNKYCSYGALKIRAKYDVDIQFVDFESKLVDSIIEEKRKMSAWDLVDDTHIPGKAWDKIFCNGRGNKQIIPKQLMKACG